MSEKLLHDAVRAVREEPLELAAAQGALRRVSQQLALATEGGGSADAVLHGCGDLARQLPAFAAGELAEARRMLVADHLRECVACRAALARLEHGPARPRRSQLVRESAGRSQPWRLAMAAGLAGLAILSGWLVWQSLDVASGPYGSVAAIGGSLSRVESGALAPLSAGAELTVGERLRTGAESGAVLRLADGSRVELAPRSEVVLARARDGRRLDLARGSVIVEAAKQKSGHLYVATDEVRVAVVGTVFAVHHGTTGSRVSVLEGQVRVDGGGRRSLLGAGEQVATGVRPVRVALAQDFAWSKNAAAYEERLAALTALGREIESVVAATELRHSTRLLDLAPAGTLVFAAAPNAGDALGSAWRLIERRVAENPALAQWWNERVVARGEDAELRALVENFERFGHELGAEIVLALAEVGQGSPRLALYAEAARPQAAIDLIEAELARAAANGEHVPTVRRITDPVAVAGQPSNAHELLLWAGPDLLVAAADGASLAAVAAHAGGTPNPFVASPFRARLAEAYERGAGWLAAVDLAGVVARSQAASPAQPQERAVLARSGVAAAEFLLLESRDLAAGTENRGLVGFSEVRQGVASWLAEPAPLAALDFVSPDALFAAAGLSKDPRAMFADLLAMAEAGGEAASLRLRLEEIERELGLSLEADLAGAFGGEIAFALDGPVLPKPSWKLVIELADEARFATAAERLVEVANRRLAAQGKPPLRLIEEAADGRIYWRLGLEGASEAVQWTVADGYLLAAPSRALLATTLAARAAGQTLPRSGRFLDHLPSSGRGDFSALAYANADALAGALEELGRAAEEAGGLSLFNAFAGSRGPAVVGVWASPRAIEMAASGGPNPLALALEAWLVGQLGSPQPAGESGAAVATQRRSVKRSIG